jgi:hypothetical protein
MATCRCGCGLIPKGQRSVWWRGHDAYAIEMLGAILADGVARRVDCRPQRDNRLPVMAQSMR